MTRTIKQAVLTDEFGNVGTYSYDSRACPKPMLLEADSVGDAKLSIPAGIFIDFEDAQAIRSKRASVEESQVRIVSSLDRIASLLEAQVRLKAKGPDA